MRRVVAGDLELALFNLAGSVHALDNACIHAGGPLSEGTVVDGVVTCPWHWWRYDVGDGRRLGSDAIRQPTYPASIEGGAVVVEVPDPKPPMSMRQQLLEHAKEWSRDE